MKRVRINQFIRSPQVRLISEKGEQAGVVDIQEALMRAREAGLDLVEVASQASPPVCRIMDFSKYKYDQEKKERLARKHQKTVHLKEVKLKPKIEEHDYQVKLKHLHRFLKKGDKAKVTLFFRGREITHPEIGKALLERITRDVSGVGEVEKGPISQGKQLIMIIAPK